MADGLVPGATDMWQTATAARRRVLEAVLTRGPVSAADIAAGLGVTAAAVRRHLDALAAAEEIRVLVEPARERGRGRPPRRYIGTEQGRAVLGSASDEIAVSALRALIEAAGPDAVRDFAEARARGLERRWAPSVTATETTETTAARGASPEQGAQRTDARIARVHALAGALSADGFAARARDVHHGPPGEAGCGVDGGHEGRGARADGHGNIAAVDGVELCQTHCPVHSVAAAFPELCEAETRAFERLLGAPVQRLATIAHGDHVCTTFVPRPARASARAGRSQDAPTEPPSDGQRGVLR